MSSRAVVVAAVVAVVLGAAVLAALRDDAAGTAGAADPASAPDAAPPGGADDEPLRDIWYVVPDRYPRADTLEERFGFDNSGFVSHLEELGFQVAERSLANYPKTAHSLAATWNLAPLDELVPEPPADRADWGPLYALLRDAELGRVVVDAGYEYVHIGSWWSPTSVSGASTVNLRPPQPPDPEGEGWRAQNRRFGAFALDELDRLATERGDGPRFVLAHLTLPHPPVAFEADGSATTDELAASRPPRDSFLAQMQYLNTRLTGLVDELTSGPPETWPVIVIQSDEGPHPPERTGAAYDWTTAPTPVLEEKLRTLSAVLLPGSDVVLPEDLTGIDTWRRVLDATIGTSYGPLEDPPVAVFPGEGDLYTWVDVSDRVD